MAYAAFLWIGEPPTVVAAALATGRLGASQILRGSSKGWAIFADEVQPTVPLGEGRGLIVGDLFRKASGISGDRPEIEDLANRSNVTPERLAREFWGRYVAFLCDPQSGALEVCRDPSGGLPCFHIRRQDLNMVFSDLGQLVALGLLEPRIDWAYVGHHIAYNGIRVARTGIEGVVEVLPGQVRRLAGREVSSRSFWRPADFVAPPQQIHDPVAARQMLFEAIETSVERLADANTAIVVELSGGLDSSIVAMALRGRAATTAVNCTTSAPEGDERRYARQVAEAAGLPLRERALDPLEIDFRRRPAPGMARPGRTTVLQSVDAAFAREGEELSATAFFNGTGGDSVFCYMTSTAPAADRLLAQGLGPGFVATVLDIAALTGSTGWKVARLALRIAFLRRAPSPIRASLEHLTPNFRPNGPDPRPWLEGLGRAPPGRRRHVEAIAGLHGHVDGHDRNIVAPVIAPHAAQPVLEAVFRIPTWLWVAEGRDRAVARQAYVDLLPTDVFNRRSKGRINRFIVEAYNANRAVIDDLLAAGVLARQGVIDMAAVRRTLGAPVDLDDAAFMSVIRLVDVELWAQGWLDAGADAS